MSGTSRTAQPTLGELNAKMLSLEKFVYTPRHNIPTGGGALPRYDLSALRRKLKDVESLVYRIPQEQEKPHQQNADESSSSDSDSPINIHIPDDELQAVKEEDDSLPHKEASEERETKPASPAKHKFPSTITEVRRMYNKIKAHEKERVQRDARIFKPEKRCTCNPNAAGVIHHVCWKKKRGSKPPLTGPPNSATSTPLGKSRGSKKKGVSSKPARSKASSLSLDDYQGPSDNSSEYFSSGMEATAQMMPSADISSAPSQQQQHEQRVFDHNGSCTINGKTWQLVDNLVYSHFCCDEVSKLETMALVHGALRRGEHVLLRAYSTAHPVSPSTNGTSAKAVIGGGITQSDRDCYLVMKSVFMESLELCRDEDYQPPIVVKRLPDDDTREVTNHTASTSSAPRSATSVTTLELTPKTWKENLGEVDGVASAAATTTLISSDHHYDSYASWQSWDDM